MKIYEGFKEKGKYVLSTENGYLFFPDKEEANKFCKENDFILL